MHSRYFVRSTLLIAAMLLATGSVVAQTDQDSPLAGTGIEPNVVSAGNSRLAGTGIEPNVVSYTEYRDPMIRFNRAMFAFNDVSYRYVLIPAARTYLAVTPAPVRTGVGNFFNNIKTPIPLANHLLQLQPRQAGIDLLRFVINTTVGVAGLFDPASAWFQLEREETGMSETLVQYGMDYGTYLVLPLIGPSNLRDGSAFLVDGMLNPLAYVLENPESLVARGFDNFQEFAPTASGYMDLRAQSSDLYIFMRNLHLQGIQRDAEYK